MTFTTPASPAPHGAVPEPPSSTAAAAIVWAEAAAWRHLTHALGVEARRQLIPLVRVNVVPLEVASRVLHRAGLSPLPSIWQVQLYASVTRKTSSTSQDRAAGAFHEEMNQAVRQALGPAATLTFEQPPQAWAAGPRGGAGLTPYDISSHPVITAPVRADTCHQARTESVAALLDALTGLAGVTADLDSTARLHVEPDPDTPTELDVDTDAPYQPYTPPPRYGAVQLTEALTARDLAIQAWQRQAKQLRSALIDALVIGDIFASPGAHAPYSTIDDLLRQLGLPGLPHAHQYEISAAIPLTVAADSPHEAHLAAYRMVRSAAATCPQFGLPITISATHRPPDIVEDGENGYRVTWHETYLVGLRGTHCTRLAEQAARLQLSVLTGDLPHVSAAALTTVYLGEHADHRLDPDHD